MRKRFVKISTMVFIFAIVIVGCFVFAGNILPSEPTFKTFDVSGYVMADGEALSDATVSCGILDTQTDQYGYYKFTGLKKVVSLTVGKEGYFFEDKLINISETTNDVNFVGYEYFDINGVVKNGDTLVSDANVVAKSVVGDFNVTTNEFGQFYFSNMAGDVEISATKNDTTFFTQTFDIKNKNVVINGTTNISGKILTDANANKEDFTITVNDENVLLNDDLTFSLQNVTASSIVKVNSDKFFVENNNIVIDSENKQLNINAYKFYSATGIVKSGKQNLNDAKIYLDNNLVDELSLQKLYGTHTISAKLDGFKFNTQTIDLNNNNYLLVGTFDIVGKVLTDDKKFDDIKIVVGKKEYILTNNENYKICDVQLNDIIKVETKTYFVKSNNIELVNLQNVNFNLEKLYNTKISVKYKNKPLNEAKVEINDKKYDLNANGELILENLHGENIVNLSLSGYHFNQEKVDFKNNNLNITPYKIFNVSGTVKSGDNVLKDAKVVLNQKEVLTNELGYFEFLNVYNQNVLTVNKDGYNTQEVNFDEDNNNLNINLTYNVLGQVVCGNKNIKDVLVKTETHNTYTNEFGYFELNNLSGTNNITFIKDFYNFEDVLVDSYIDLKISTSYNITGNLSNSVGVIANFTVILIDLKDNSIKETTTDKNGDYFFNNLIGDYFLICSTDTNITLKPISYDISEGGIYNFMDKGYGFSGYITSGNIPVKGVKLTVGDISVVTDDNGFYKFDLILKPSIMIISKDNYTFSQNNIEVNEEYDQKDDINFTCSYKVFGLVTSGNTKLGDVNVKVGNKTVKTNDDGYYEINLIEGQNEVVVYKDGYKFNGVDLVEEGGKFDFEAMYDETIEVFSNDVKVYDYEIVYNGETYKSNREGFVTLYNVKIGETFKVVKQNYNFETQTLSGYTKSVKKVNGSYSIVGTIYSGTKVLSNVKVLYNDTFVKTDTNGQFKIDGLFGNSTLNFELDMYNFDSLVVNGGTSTLKVYAKYSVTGYVKVGNIPLKDVTVTAGDIVVATNSQGLFKIDNLKTEVVLKFEKMGYTFTEEIKVNGPAKLNVKATYMIKGTVVSGNLKVSGVLVKTNTGLDTITSDLGEFVLDGIDGKVDITFSKEGYESVTEKNISNYNENLQVSLKYEVIINFNGLDNDLGYNDIGIMLNGINSTYSNKTVTLNGLMGTNEIEFVKQNYNFNPQRYIVEEYTTINVSLKKVYSISGYVTVLDANIPVKGAKVYAGELMALTDNDGKYTISGLEKPALVYVSLDIGGEEKPEVVYKKNYGQVSEPGSSYNISIPNYDYAYYMFKRGYDNLDRALTYQIYGTGVVTPDVGGSQNVAITYKKDSKNIKLIQNLNFGNVVMGVDPMVSVLTYVDLNTKNVKFKRVETSANITKNGDEYFANYPDAWTNSTLADYDKRGIDPFGYYPYNINKETISNFSKITYNSKTKEYNFTLTLNAKNNMTYAQYAKQMKYMVEEQTLQYFNSITLGYTFYDNGFIKKMTIDEEYMVSADSFPSVKVKTVGKFVYNFLTKSLDEYIPDFKTDTAKNVSESLKQQTPQIKTLTKALIIDNYDFNKKKKEDK